MASRYANSLSAAISRRDFLRLSGASVAGATLLGIAGCGGGGGGAEGGSIRAAGWNVAAEALEETLEGFNEEYPDINVQVQYVDPEYEQITPRLQSGQGAPDIIQTQQRDFHNFLARFPNQFADITDWIGPHQDEFVETAWAAVEREGQAYAVPWDLGPAAVWYRTDYFEQAGIDAESITTWDQFIEAGKQLQQQIDGVAMTTFDRSGEDAFGQWEVMMNQQGGSYYDEEGRLLLANEANITALEMLLRFIEEGLVVNSPTWDDRIRVLANGDAATIIYPVWYAGTIRTQAKDQKGKWGAFPLPAFTEGGNRQANTGGSILTISEQSQNKEAAWKFLEHTLLTVEGQDIQMEYGLFPSWQPYYDSEASEETDPYFGFSLVEFFGDLTTDIPSLDYGPHFLTIEPELNNAFASVLGGETDPEQALRAAEERVAQATDVEIARD